LDHPCRFAGPHSQLGSFKSGENSLKSQTQELFWIEDWNLFSTVRDHQDRSKHSLEGVHNTVHYAVGGSYYEGHMSAIAYAGEASPREALSWADSILKIRLRSNILPAPLSSRSLVVAVEPYPWCVGSRARCEHRFFELSFIVYR
jgi:hypothetical protein